MPYDLWVDQICINQKDIRERDQQVMLMRDIYATSQMVCVWLGEQHAEVYVRTSFRFSVKCSGLGKVLRTMSLMIQKP